MTPIFATFLQDHAEQVEHAAEAGHGAEAGPSTPAK